MCEEINQPDVHICECQVCQSETDIIRNIDSLLTGFFLPVRLLLVLVYLFGGAIDTDSTQYINFVYQALSCFVLGTGHLLLP